MRVLVTFLLLACCNSCLSIGVHNRESNKLLANARNDAQFFQGIGNWFGNLKNDVCERWFGPAATTPSSPVPTEAFDLDKFQLQHRLRNREWLQVDLSTLSFNPDQDWGYRVGNWYFIRKGLKGPKSLEKNGSGESDIPLQGTTESTPVEIEATLHDATKDPQTTESSTISSTVAASTFSNMMQPTTPEINTQSTAQTTTVQVDLSENSSKQDNEPDNTARKGSAEVLME